MSQQIIDTFNAKGFVEYKGHRLHAAGGGAVHVEGLGYYDTIGQAIDVVDGLLMDFQATKAMREWWADNVAKTGDINPPVPEIVERNP